MEKIWDFMSIYWSYYKEQLFRKNLKKEEKVDCLALRLSMRFPEKNSLSFHQQSAK